MRERSRRGRNRAFLCIEQLRESENSRSRRKIMGKSTWFKEGKKNSQWNNATGPLPRPGKRKKIEGEELRNRSVIFVEHTPGGELAKLIRNQLTRMEELMGFKIKVVERAGTALKDLFSPTNIWRGGACSRLDCTTCTQGGGRPPRLYKEKHHL